MKRPSLPHPSVSVAVLSLAMLVLRGGTLAGAFRQAPTTLTILAAASLTDPFEELGRRMELRTPGLKVQFSFAGSQQLVLQLEEGVTADVFASADERWMSQAKNRGLLEGDPQIFATNRLVVLMPRANPARIGSLPDLARRGTKIVLAAEVVPVGTYSREALGKLASAPGFPPSYEGQVLANVVSEEDNVKGVVAKVQLGEADAGIVYRSDITPAVARSVLTLDIPDEYNVLATYPIALIRNGKSKPAARDFIRLVLSDEGQRVLRERGWLSAGVLTNTSARPSP